VRLRSYGATAGVVGRNRDGGSGQTPPSVGLIFSTCRGALPAFAAGADRQRVDAGLLEERAGGRGGARNRARNALVDDHMRALVPRPSRHPCAVRRDQRRAGAGIARSGRMGVDIRDQPRAEHENEGRCCHCSHHVAISFCVRSRARSRKARARTIP